MNVYCVCSFRIMSYGNNNTDRQYSRDSHSCAVSGFVYKKAYCGTMIFRFHDICNKLTDNNNINDDDSCV